MLKCFVVMGYGEKTDLHQNKTFDLDKSYRYIIKPAVEAAGYTCVRADEIQHAGNSERLDARPGHEHAAATVAGRWKARQR